VALDRSQRTNAGIEHEQRPAAGVDVMTRLHRDTGSRPVAPDPAALWRDLGVKALGDGVEFDDAAPLAAIRKSITGGWSK